MKLHLVLLTGLIAMGFAMTATAGSVTDTDGDGVPDSFDNCSTIPNGPVSSGPNDLTNQGDTDQDGFGNACDGDFDQDNLTQTSDAQIFLGDFPGAADLTDMTGDGLAQTNDFQIFLGFFPTDPPGPSGLSCADPFIDVGAGDTPCTP